MSEKPQQQWEAVFIDGGHPLQRTAVPGGWLYRDMKTQSIAFVPKPADLLFLDPSHGHD